MERGVRGAPAFPSCSAKVKLNQEYASWSLRPVILKLEQASESPGGLSKTQVVRHHPTVSDSASDS